MKLKGFLKGFFILGLILLPISFSSATKYELNQPTALNNLGEDAIFTFTNGSNFNINSLYYNYMVAGSNNAKYNLFWNNTGLYFVYSYNWGTTDLIQGFIKKFCRTTYNNYCNGSTQATWINIDEFLGNSNYTNADYFDVYQSNTSSINFCFGYESLNESICFLISPYSQNEFSAYGGSLGITRNPNLADLPNDSIKNYFTVSPFSSSSPSVPESPVSDIVFYSDNNQVYYDFLTLLGYNTGLCYGDFALTDITITDGNSFQFFPSEVGTGADIFTLKDYWYSNFDNYSWYGQIRGLYNVSNRNNDYTPFMGKSKGYYRLVYKVENQSYFSAYQPNGTDLFIYCDMVLNGFESNGLFTGKLSSSATNIFINSDYRNHYGENKDGEFVLSGANSYFSGEDVGYFDIFNRLYTRFRNGFKVDGSEDYRVGILPSFVVFGFFLMLLLYLFKR